MGWNQGYEIIEKQVVTLYDLGVLNKEVLNAIIEPFSGTDLDSGGSEGLKSKDGKSFENIVCFIMDECRYNKAVENFIPDEDEPDWNEDLYDLYKEISKREWGLW